MIYQCPRCKILLNNQEELDLHLITTQRCEVVLGELAQGITASIERKLRNRGKTYRAQSEEDRWKEIYQTLFPMETPPSPCKFDL